MFDFRLINTNEGIQVIDRTLKTPYESLSLSSMIEYIQVDNSLAFQDRIKKREQKTEKRNRSFIKRFIMTLAAF